MICRVRGYSLAVVMPDNVTRERRQLLDDLRRRDHRLTGSLGSNGAVELARSLVARGLAIRDARPIRQPAQPTRPLRDDGAEILADCPEMDVFVAGLGTGGTLMGVGGGCAKHKPAVRIYAAEPMPGEAVQGLRSIDEGFVPEIFDDPHSMAASWCRPRSRSRRCAA